MKRKTSFILAAVACLILIPLAAVRAITVSPVLLEFDIAKGASKQGKIRIWNETAEPQTYSVVVRNFVPKGEEGEQEYIEEETPTSLASWVTVERQPVTLAPDASTELSFLISVPAGAEPGGHYATIFFASGPVKGQGGVGVSSRIGVLLLVNVPGEIREEARIESFRIMSGADIPRLRSGQAVRPYGGNVISRLPANFELRVRNLGSTHVRPDGWLVVRNLIGWEVARAPANPKKSSVLPGSVRRIDAAWQKTDDGPPVGDLASRSPADRQGAGWWAETKSEWRNFALGRYTATLDASYGSRNEKFPMQTISFWVFPWHLALFALAGVAGLFVLWRLRHALRVRAALRRDR